MATGLINWVQIENIVWSYVFNFFCSEQFEDPLQRHIIDDDDNQHLSDVVRKID